MKHFLVFLVMFIFLTGTVRAEGITSDTLVITATAPELYALPVSSVPTEIAEMFQSVSSTQVIAERIVKKGKGSMIAVVTTDAFAEGQVAIDGVTRWRVSRGTDYPICGYVVDNWQVWMLWRDQNGSLGKAAEPFDVRERHPSGAYYSWYARPDVFPTPTPTPTPAPLSGVAVF